MNLRRQEKGGVCRIRFEGALCIQHVAGLWRSLQAESDGMLPLELDLSGVTECDAAGVQLIVAAVSQGRAAGRQIAVADAGGIAAQCIAASGVSLEWLTQAGEGSAHV